VTGSLGPSIPRRPRAGALPLICLPYAGGGARCYGSWENLLPPEVDALTIRLPGRDSRLGEPLPGDLVTVAAQVAGELAPVLPARFAVFGHSMGALLAFELARELRSQLGLEAACLVVSGAPARGRADQDRRYEDLDDADLRAALAAMGGTDAELLRDPEVWGLIRPVVRADLLMCDRYRLAPGKPLDCPIVAYGARDDWSLAAGSAESWREHTTGCFEQRMFPGDHFYFQRIPQAFVMDLVRRLYRHAL
jgi:medium-chain acyl-[acyl-carrier-protein] hydrolase